MDASNRALFERIADSLDELLTAAPQTDEPAADDPQKRAAVLAGKAARRAAALSGMLAVPPGPMAWLAVLPDLLANRAALSGAKIAIEDVASGAVLAEQSGIRRPGKPMASPFPDVEEIEPIERERPSPRHSDPLEDYR